MLLMTIFVNVIVVVARLDEPVFGNLTLATLRITVRFASGCRMTTARTHVTGYDVSTRGGHAAFTASDGRAQYAVQP